MKHVFFVLFAVGILVFYGNNSKKRRYYVPEIKVISDTNKIRLNGVYSLYDTSKGNDSAEAFKKYIYISPILFLNKNQFIQSPHSDWIKSNFIKEIKNNNEQLDYGKYYFNGDTIHLKGLFTFFATGMDWRQYPANYTGYLDPTGDTLYLKLAKPFPKIDMKLNRHLAKRLKEASCQKYIFKPLPKDNIPVDINIEHLFPIQKKKKRAQH